MMKTEMITTNRTQTLEEITPEKAAFYLTLSRGNGVRKKALDPAHVRHFVELIEQGLFHTPNEGVAFHQDGWLANAHHRLNAIVRAGKPVIMWVARGLSDDDVLALDQGKKRSMSDLTGLDRKISDCMNYAYRIINPANRKPRAQDLLSSLDLPFAKKLIELHGLCGDKTKVFGSSPIQCSAVFWAINGAQDYAFEQYIALSRMEFSKFSPISALFAKRVTLSQIGGKNSDELFAIGMRVFNPSKANYKKLYSTGDDVRSEFRELGHLIFNISSK